MRHKLRYACPYFEVLFDPKKFKEGMTVDARLRELEIDEQRYGPAPTSSLPVVAITDVGDLPKTNVSANVVFSLFLYILHTPNGPWSAVTRAQSINLLALLAIVADRFGAHATIADYLKEQRLDITLLRSKKSATVHQNELENRQMLLAGMIFEFPKWVYQCSAALIVNGSRMWNPISPVSYEENRGHGRDAIWHRLPNGVEGIYSILLQYQFDTWY